MEPGPLRGPSAINLFSLCSPRGEPAAKLPSPLDPPFTSSACHLMLFLQLRGVEGAEPPCSTAGPEARGATLRERCNLSLYITSIPAINLLTFHYNHAHFHRLHGHNFSYKYYPSMPETNGKYCKSWSGLYRPRSK